MKQGESQPIQQGNKIERKAVNTGNKVSPRDFIAFLLSAVYFGFYYLAMFVE